MINLYRYLFYRLYSWNLRTWGENDIPQWNAMLGVSFMMFLNLGVIAGIIDLVGLNIFTVDTPLIEIIVIMVVLFCINYFWLIHNNKFKEIASEFKKESTKQKNIKSLLLWIYVIVSFIVVSVIGVLSGKVNGNI